MSAADERATGRPPPGFCRSGLGRRALLRGLCGCCSGLAALGAAPGALLPTPSQAQSGGLSTDDAGLRAIMDKAEARLRTSPHRLIDPEVNAYLARIACRIAEPRCGEIRVYVMRAPYFNASMAPNGMMQIWTGALLRLENEAQLAAVMAHEIAHYIEDHALHNWRRIRDGSDLAMFLTAISAGLLAPIAQLAVIADALAFSREQETEADAIGLDLMSAAGYRAEAAPQIWRNIEAELGVDPTAKEADVFSQTHPTPPDRLAALAAQAQKAPPGGDTGVEDYLAQARLLRERLLADDLGLRKPDRTLIILERLDKVDRAAPDLAYFRGEALRLRRGSGDKRAAKAAYQQAIDRDPTYAEAWRGLGRIERALGDNDAGRAAFERYLELNPGAPDAAFLRAYIDS